MAAMKLSYAGQMGLSRMAPKVETVVISLWGNDKALQDIEQKQRVSSAKAEKSFKLNVGGFISIPTKDALAKPKYSHVQQSNTAQSKSNDGIIDPFEGLPFRAFAEKVGEHILPVIKAAREDQRRAVAEGRLAAESVVPEAPMVPHFLPFTRWASSSDAVRDTLVAEDPKNRKKARLSWYHPDDGMVPRGWFSQGLMADFKYYMPFGFGASASK